MNINWYPGHMKKTKELLQSNLKLVDLVVELLDSRIPLSSKNPDIDNIITNKPKIVLFNKSDLADERNISAWQKYYDELGVQTLRINSLNGFNTNKIQEVAREAMKEKLESLKNKGRKERPIRMMIIGIPNVGKSSLINKLSGKKSAKVGDRPGVTKSKQWVKLKGNLELLDTPGILWPKFEDQEVALKLAFTGAIKDEILDVETLALRFLEKTMFEYKENILTRYKIDVDREFETALELMEEIGVKRGCKIRGNDFDYTRIANIVLNEFRGGLLGKISLEWPSDIKDDEETNEELEQEEN
ncbi:ribosome biogenesis GTPase YlqF [Peptostreptococcaceae bacterium AGR-M142]